VSVIAQAAWLSLSVVLGGLTHIAFIKKNLLPGLATRRLDGGLTLRGRPIFGANKTLRGALVMTAATALWTVIIDSIQRIGGLDDGLRYVSTDQIGSLALGALLGGAYILGELPNSFLKRQLDISPGFPAKGPMKPVFWTLDQLDSALAVLLALSLLRVPSLVFAVVLLAITMLLHPTIAALMVMLGLKDRVG